MVVCQSENLRSKAIGVVTELRRSGLDADLVLEDKKMKWIFQRADKLGMCTYLHIYIYIYIFVCMYVYSFIYVLYNFMTIYIFTFYM